ncbi:MAG TPA: hypothetical protein PLP89_01645 [Synergistales bacterium]|jgi:hypothetical protein|nr:hypothetical protein [Synergistales bacterium]HRV71382.1 hypothetical protein [Thermovirgaceae bacterium]
MKTVSSRDLKNNPGILADSDVTVVYSRSKPMAVCVSVSEGEDVLSLADAMLQMRAQRALELARIMARENGTDRIPDSEIDAEIRSLRAAQKKD